MENQCPHPDTDGGPDRGSDIDTPRWVKVFGLIAVAVILLFVIVLVTGGGNHGPRRHTGGGAGDSTPSSVTDHTSPTRDHTP